MALVKKAFGSKVMYVDNKNKLLFTYAAVKNARERYAKEVAKKTSGQ